MSDTINSASTVIASGYRVRVVEALQEGPRTPTEITEETGMKIAHVSRSLSKLRGEGIVSLLVPEDRKKGRLYGLTDLGRDVYEWLDETGRLEEADQS